MTGAGATAAGAAVCAGAAVWLGPGRDRGLRRARLMFGPADDPVPVWRRPVSVVRGRLGREWLCLVAAVGIAVLGESVLPLVAGALAVPLVGRRLRARERRLAGLRRGAGAVALCGAVAGELRAGRQPGHALYAAVSGSGALGRAEAAVLAAARFGGDVPAALRLASGEPGAAGLAGMAACWQVAVAGGAGLAAGLERLEGALRAEHDQREDLRAQLTTARSTAVVLAVMPLAGLVLGTGLGAEPLRVLLHTPAGVGCLLAAGVLEAAGLIWAGRIVRKGEGR
ncbi:type II secretion system F family protein [Streptomyces sannanensis]|uniref:Type II secretion system F family protein n=1 Tax=Streptomyces sannanensis TaxID=285536 RepID=A0ABP6SD01_9ACTN